MSSITEQFSAVTKSQLEAQFQIFNSLAHSAVDSAEKLIALNLSTTKASVQQSSATAKKLLEVKDAGEFFSASRETATGIDSLLAYSRQLFAIASGAQAELIKNTRGAALPPFAAPALAAVKAAAPVAEAVKAVTPVVVDEPAPTPAAAAPLASPVAAPAAAAVAEAAPPATTIEAAVSAAVHADQAPALDTPAKVAPAPLAAAVAPTAPEAIKPALKPATEITPPAAAKPAFPATKPITLAADTKTTKLKAVAPKAKTADAPAGKHKK